MTKREKIEATHGSGNVYQDLGLNEANTRQLKAELAAEIIHILRNRRLSQRKAAGVPSAQQ